MQPEIKVWDEEEKICVLTAASRQTRGPRGDAKELLLLLLTRQLKEKKINQRRKKRRK